MSDSVTVDIQFKNPEAAEKAILELGGRSLGQGTHTLYSSSETGLGFTLPGWRYPLVIHEDGTLTYDDYHGAWGNVKDIDKLKDVYALLAVQAECGNLGWYCEINQEKTALTVYHPDGGTIVVGQGGEIEASGFVGSSCSVATGKLQEALGKKIQETLKPEYSQVHLDQGEIEQ